MKTETARGGETKIEGRKEQGGGDAKIAEQAQG